MNDGSMKIDDSIFRWDSYSDQPATIDKRVKRKLRWHSIRSVSKKILAVVFLFRPLLATILRKKSSLPRTDDHSIGICVNLERPFLDKKVLSGAETAAIVKQLNLRRIAVRIPLADIHNLHEYVEFIRYFPEHSILVVILQDRNTIENPATLEDSLDRIFHALSGTVNCYQIGNAVNRFKWGFVTVDEWFGFFRVAWSLRNRKYPDVKLLGGAIIDFELLDYCRTLCNGFSFKYDGYASLLYVDRRGAPENRQMGFDLERKISLLCRIMESSDKVDSADARLWITEVNWPLEGTGRHSPTLDNSRVGEREQLLYLVRYYLLALATGAVAACYWHQLVAPGYGLIDNRRGVLRKRPAYYGFATLCRLFNGAHIEHFSRQRELGYYRLKARNHGREILALWCCGRTATIVMPPRKQAIDIEGRMMSITEGQSLTIGDSATYLIDAAPPPDVRSLDSTDAVAR